MFPFEWASVPTLNLVKPLLDDPSMEIRVFFTGLVKAAAESLGHGRSIRGQSRRTLNVRLITIKKHNLLFSLSANVQEPRFGLIMVGSIVRGVAFF